MTKLVWTIAVLAFMAAAPGGPVLAQEGDAVKGEKVFKKCKACHKIGDKAKNGVGPLMNEIVGRQAGTVEGYKYSKINIASGENGLVWDEEQIFEYLPDPNKFLKKFLDDAGKGDLAKGRTKMTYKLKKEKDRRNVIAYLKTFSTDQ